jgi:hypothetical protein
MGRGGGGLHALALGRILFPLLNVEKWLKSPCNQRGSANTGGGADGLGAGKPPNGGGITANAGEHPYLLRSDSANG